MPKRILKGMVVSTKMVNTVVVSVNRLKAHPKYQKMMNVTKKNKAHDVGNELKEGDTVLIEETPPVSRDKKWIVKEKVI